jgi:hypothetical protein
VEPWNDVSTNARKEKGEVCGVEPHFARHNNDMSQAVAAYSYSHGAEAEKKN